MAHLLRSTLIFSSLLLLHVASAQPTLNEPLAGRPVAAVLGELVQRGWRFAYSTNLIGEDLLVEQEPSTRAPVEMVREILRPHRLTVREHGELLLVVRMTEAEISALAPVAEFQTVESESNERLVETITVSASRYELSRDLSNTRFYLDQQSVEALPDIGDDPVRATQRLPGVASAPYSSSGYVRGGERSETNIFLNGHRLLDPFHVRDFQSVFSSIDNRAINGIEVYTGGFPVLYGNGLSGLVLIDALNPDSPNRTELGISAYNSSLLASRTSSDGDVQWLVSARRGNLDLILDDDFGDPSYYDVFGQLSINLTPTTQLSINALHARDNALVVLENDIEEEEESNSDTDNTQVWLRLDSEWSDELRSTTVLSFARLDTARFGTTNNADDYVSFASDRRNVTELVFRQDWSWDAAERHKMLWGMQFERGEAEYEYRSEVTYFELAELLAGTDETELSSAQLAPELDSFSLYLSDRWRIRDNTVLDLGLRWDTQTFTTGTSGSQLSPRIGVFHALTPQTDFRVSWGRYHQAQAIGRLQVEDGVTRYWPAQRADQWIASLNHRLSERYSLRVEAFEKTVDRPRPRYENLFDPFTVNPELAPDRVLLTPLSATMRGLEVSLRFDGGNGFDWWAAYTIANAEDRFVGRSEPRSWDQRHALLAGISWSTERWQAALAMTVHSGWPRTPLSLIAGFDDEGEPELLPLVGERNSKRYPTFATIDARVSRKFDVRRGTLSVFAEVSNLTNRRNVCCSDFDIEEDATGNDMLDLSDDFWPPLLPAIGILWEF